MGVNRSIETVFPALDPARYQPHALHSAERIWPETNCYADLWIEVLHAQGLAPEAVLGFTLTQDFEGDQFTFFKVPLEDLETLYDIRVTELAIFDALDAHVTTQIGRGRLCLIEMDSFYMPDTQGVAYHTEHGKTTVAINRLNVNERVMDYFHNGGFFRLEGEDFDGVFGRHYPAGSPPFLPYTEFAKFPEHYPTQDRLRRRARDIIVGHRRRMPKTNPLAAYSMVFPDQVARLAERDFGFFHKYAFNTLRQVGANFELAASHFEWIGCGDELHEARLAALKIAETAKTAQFQLARAVTRRKFDALAHTLDPAIEAWDQMSESLKSRFG